MRNRTAVALLLAASLLAFGGALRNGYVWDDFDHVLKNPNLADFRSGLVYFVSDEGLGNGEELPYYRPLTMLSFAVDNVLWLGWPVGYHGTSLALHTLTCILLFAAIRKVTGHAAAALAATAVFAVHPAHAEPVAYISARADLLCGLFLTAAFLAHLLHEEEGRARYQWASVAAYAAALLSKVIAVVFPFVLALHLLLLGGGRRRIVRLVAPYVCLTLAFLLAREYFVEKDVWFDVPLLDRIAVTTWLLQKYLSNALFPAGLKVFYGDAPPPVFPVPVLAAGMLAVLAWLAVRCRNGAPAITLGAAWFFLALFPVSGAITILYPAVMADRYLYVPMIGGAVALAGGIVRAGAFGISGKARWFRGAAAAAVVLVLAGVSAGRVRAWSNPVVLWEAAARDAPGNPYVINRLAMTYAVEQRYDEAERLFVSIKDVCTNSAVFVNLAMVSLDRGDTRKAERQGIEAVERFPTDRHAWWVLGHIYAKLGDPVKSIAALEMSLAIQPDNAAARRLIAAQRKMLASLGGALPAARGR